MAWGKQQGFVWYPSKECTSGKDGGTNWAWCSNLPKFGWKCKCGAMHPGKKPGPPPAPHKDDDMDLQQFFAKILAEQPEDVRKEAETKYGSAPAKVAKRTPLMDQQQAIEAVQVADKAFQKAARDLAHHLTHTSKAQAAFDAAALELQKATDEKEKLMASEQQPRPEVTELLVQGAEFNFSKLGLAEVLNEDADKAAIETLAG